MRNVNTSLTALYGNKLIKNICKTETSPESLEWRALPVG